MNSADAYSLLRGVLENGYPETIPLRWQSEDQDSQGNTDLPDIPSTFLYTEMFVYRTVIFSYGGGVGNNLYRNYSTLDTYVFVPKGSGVAYALYYANLAGDLFRSYKVNDLLVRSVAVSPGGDGATLKPEGLASAVDNYYYASVSVDFTFDEIG